jgi:hypothetical protein
MKIYTKTITFILLFSIILSCTKDFEKTNIDPHTAVDVQPEFLMRKVWYDYLDNMAYEGFVAGNLLGQYFTAIDFNLFDRHSLSEPQYGGKPWNFIYENLNDNEILIKKSQENKAFEVYYGPALVFKAYTTMALTDLYGDVPFSQALQGKEGVTLPAYDKQEDIYLKEGGILDLLGKAEIALNAYNGAIKLQGDIIYNGNLEKWIKLARSLKLKALIRISAVADVRAEINSLVTAGGMIENSTDNAFFSFNTSPPNNFRMSTAKTGDYNLFIMSATIDSILSISEDPRKDVYFRPTASNASKFKGLLNGPDASRLSITTADFSLTGRIFREDAGKLKAIVMGSYETAFLISEAIVKGFVHGNAQYWYEKGIMDGMEWWNISMPSNFLQKESVKYDETKAMQQIITQKWMVNIMNGYEGWIEYRRTGFPALKNVAASLNNQLIPVRMPYPASEAALNNEKYQVAATATEGNSINVPVWWDK